jgi:hypothetical protein
VFGAGGPGPPPGRPQNEGLRGVLAGYDEYFKSVAQRKGLLILEGTPAFEKQSGIERQAELKKLFEAMDEGSLLELRQGKGGSLWSMPGRGSSPRLLESYDKSQAPPSPKSMAGRWFYYLGVGALMDKSAFTFNYGLKVGSYLLGDRFDMAVGYDSSSSLTYDSYSQDFITNYTLSLSGRVHMPLGSHFDGSLGAQGSIGGSNAPNSQASTDTALLAGLSYLFGAGSVDLNGRFGTGAPSFSLGVTRMLDGGNRPKPVAAAKAKPKAKVAGLEPAAAKTPTPVPSFEPTPQATAMPTPQATAMPTPQAAAMPTPQATAMPTTQATAMPTTQATAMPTTQATAMPEEAPAKTSTPEAAEPAAPGPGSFHPRHLLLLGSAYYLLGMVTDLQDYGNYLVSKAGGTGGSPVHDYAPNFSASYSYCGWTLGWQSLWFSQGMGATLSGPGETQASLGVQAFSLGYDIPFNRPFGALGPLQFYAPLRVEYATVSLNFDQNPGGLRKFSTDLIGGSAGLGLRLYMGRWTCLDLSGRYHFTGSAKFQEAVYPELSNPTGKDLQADRSGVEASAALGLAIW